MASKKSRPWHAAAVPAPATTRRPRKGKLAGSIIALSSAAIVSIYTLGRTNTSSAYDQLTAEAPTAAAPPAAAGRAAASVVPSTTRTASAPAQTTAYKDGTYTGSGNSRHGGMTVKVVIKGGKIVSANVASCSTHYSCSDVDQLVSAAVSKQSVPANHVSGATDSSQAYKQALTGALNQAKA